MTPTAMVEPENSAVQYIKQDLPWATPLGNVTWAANGSMVNESVSIFGARDVFRPAADATVLARHGDGAPAATVRTAGRGRAFFLGFLPGLSYYAPAIPQRPADRGGTDAAFSHFLPTNFSVEVRELVTGMASPAQIGIF